MPLPLFFTISVVTTMLVNSKRRWQILVAIGGFTWLIAVMIASTLNAPSEIVLMLNRASIVVLTGEALTIMIPFFTLNNKNS